MKTIHFGHLLFVIFLFSLISCQQTREDLNIKEAATGNPGEILVILPDAQWEGEVGEALKSIYHKDLYTVPQEEHIFDLYPLKKSEFVGLNQRNRNVIMPLLGGGAEYGSISIEQDVYSSPQTIVYIKAPDAESFAQTVKDNELKLVEIFKKADRDRQTPFLLKHYIEKYAQEIQEKYGVFFAVPRSYTFDEKRENFAWLSYETRYYTYNFLVYRYAADTVKGKPTLDYLVEQRNEILKKNISGEHPNSYMSTETKFHYPILTGRIVNNHDCWVMEGLWKVQGDFMGGPFISFTMVDESANEYVTVEGFVYDPRGENRDQIRKLEAVLWTMKLM